MRALVWTPFMALWCALPAIADTNIAIIDSGVDYKHKDLSAQMWTEPGTDPHYPNDTHGWNFANNNNKVIDYSYLGTFSADCTEFFAVQGRLFLGTATAADRSWYATHKADPKFIIELETFGNFVHGTHVAGISVRDSDDARIIAEKIIPTAVPTAAASLLEQVGQAYGYPLVGTDDDKISQYLKFAANAQAAMLTRSSKYAAAKGAVVANGSFGVGVKAALPVIANFLKQVMGRDPTDAETQRYTYEFIQDVVVACHDFVGAAPKTLFVFAAGNDGTDNDQLPESPGNIKTDNTIAVGATLGLAKLASFSNYGATMVEVAAPGVVINSTIPGDLYLQLSGTSMAAPYVTNAAARVASANAELTPKQIKKILMQTVDEKDFLAGKVSTSGIVNTDRAVFAALQSTYLPLDTAIFEANLAIADMFDDSPTAVAPLTDNDVFVLPLPSTIY